MYMQYKITEMILGIGKKSHKIILTKKNRLGQVQSTSVRAQSMKMYGNTRKSLEILDFPDFSDFYFFRNFLRKKYFLLKSFLF